ncbi:MAG: sigma-70 family RNA polymerase sigma factor [Myxococcota bacterium]|nr:sigma-70 family RNA polymerase sigma factor [Myxococcota bacterium]
MRASPPPSACDPAAEASALVDAARTGDRRAFSELVRRYRPRIYALALQLTGSASEADDVTQDAFLRAFANMSRFEGRSEFFTWLYRIALNRALNGRRDGRRRQRVDMDDPRVQAALAVDAGGDPRRAMELRETYAQLVAALDALSPVLRTTVVLTVLQRLSQREAAVVLGTTEGTVAWRIHEARRQMRETLRRLQREPTPARALRAGAEARDAHVTDGLEAGLALLGRLATVASRT